MKKVLAAIVTFIFGVCLISATAATSSAASIKKVSSFKADVTPVTVTLSWKKSSDAKGYEIQQKVSKKWKTVATISKAKTTSYTFKKLKNGTTYEYRICAVNGKKKGAYVSVKAKTGVPKITGVKATSTSLTSVKLSWTKANVTGYEIQRKEGKKWKTVTRIKKAKTTSYTVSKLAAGSSVTFRIRGYYEGSVKDYFGSYTEVKGKGAVPAMSTASVKSVNESSVTLTWSKVSGATGYEIQRKDGKNWKAVATISKGSTTSYTVSKLSALTNYEFRIRAVQKSGKTNYYNSWKTVKAKTTIGTVSGLAASSVTASSAKLTWKAAAGAKGYYVYNNGKKIATVAATSYTLPASAATTYKITVAPYNGSTVGKATSAVSFTTLCAKVTGLKVATTETTATASWTKTAGAVSYQLQYSVNGGSWSSAVTVSGTSYKLSGVKQNATYAFRVRAANKNGSKVQYGEYSATASAKTLGISFSGTTISWAAVSGAATYTLQQFEAGAWKDLAAKTKNTSHNYSALATDAGKLFRVIAYNSSNKAVFTSASYSANGGYVPFSVNADNTLSVSWGAFSGASEYELVICSQGMDDDGETVVTVKAPATSTTRILAPGLTYDVKLLAIKNNKETVLAKFTVTTSALKTGTSDKEKHAQLLYLVEAINRSKFDRTSTYTFGYNYYNKTNVGYMDFGFQLGNDPFGIKGAAVNVLLGLLFSDSLDGLEKGKDYDFKNGFIRCYTTKAIDSIFSSMEDGTTTDKISESLNVGGKTGLIFTNGVNPSDFDVASVMQPVGNEDGVAYLYNSQNIAACLSAFSSVTTTKVGNNYRIVAKIKTENDPKVHSGFVSSSSTGDFSLENMGEAKISSSFGETTLTAEIDGNCRLISYTIDSPYKCDMKVALAIDSDEANLDAEDDATAAALADVMKLLEKIVIEMNIKASGEQTYTYTYKR
ncbi:MAG: fibronectin type III domain-containing protein [Clostridia bacterium]|nr:fibronectin type III domain-containing protein [Clostridia bacterium]